MHKNQKTDKKVNGKAVKHSQNLLNNLKMSFKPRILNIESQGQSTMGGSSTAHLQDHGQQAFINYTFQQSPTINYYPVFEDNSKSNGQMTNVDVPENIRKSQRRSRDPI